MEMISLEQRAGIVASAERLDNVAVVETDQRLAARFFLNDPRDVFHNEVGHHRREELEVIEREPSFRRIAEHAASGAFLRQFFEPWLCCGESNGVVLPRG